MCLFLSRPLRLWPLLLLLGSLLPPCPAAATPLDRGTAREIALLLAEPAPQTLSVGAPVPVDGRPMRRADAQAVTLLLENPQVLAD